MTHDAPTDLDRQEDLERQYREFRKEPDRTVFCSWCGKGNRHGLPACCLSFAEGVAAIGKKQFESVQKQLREVHLGSRVSIKCPYCETHLKKVGPDTHPSEWIKPMVSPFCCTLLRDAATAIVERKTLEQLTAEKKRIEDNLPTLVVN